MSKAQSEIVKVTAEQLAKFADGGAEYDGASGDTLGRVAMCYGTPEEEKMYGPDIKRGQLVDVLECRALKSTRFVPVAGWESWIKWSKGAKTPDYVYRRNEYHKIPKIDLMDGTNPDGSWSPPLAMHTHNWIVAVEGEPYPFLFTFRRTAHKAGDFIRMTDARRRITKQGSALYNAKLIDDKNAAGQAYKRLTVEVVGNCPDDLRPLILTAREAFARLQERAASLETETGHVDRPDDGIPL